MKPIVLAVALAAQTASAEDGWIGVFTSDEIPGRACRIDSSGLVSSSSYGCEKLRQGQLHPAELAATMAHQLSSDMREEAERAG